MFIEQAIFTSAATDRAQGYQLISRSPGLSEADARELAVWGPSHDSLLERPGERSSVNFFRLNSGLYCVSRTALAGAEYSCRGGEVVYTQFLVVPPEVLARFRNNPFAVLRAATAIGAMEVREAIPDALEPLQLGGRSAAIDLELVAQLARDPGPAVLATLIQAALASDRLAVASPTHGEQLIAGLVSALPVECRVEFSFSTGLKCSPSRPVRIVSLPSEPSSWRATARSGFTLLDLHQPEVADEVCWTGWAGCVARILSAGRLSLLAHELESARPWLNCANLTVLCEQIVSKLPAGAPSATVAGNGRAAPLAGPEASADHSSPVTQRADQAHFRQQEAVATAPRPASPGAIDELAEALAAQPREVLELLERIDDLVFTAISGDSRALAELEVLWPTVVAELDVDLIEQSREQYLRCALSICNECFDGEVQRPERAAAAIDVLCVLFED